LLDVAEFLGEVNLDGWRVVDDDYGQAVGKLQAESMMSTAEVFSLSKKPRYVDQEKSRQITEGDA
jgi:hypothetical protein